MNIGDKVKFCLDSHPHAYGEGIIRAIYSHSVEVELTTQCKEFSPGVMIIVDKREMIQDLDSF